MVLKAHVPVPGVVLKRQGRQIYAPNHRGVCPLYQIAPAQCALITLRKPQFLTRTHSPGNGERLSLAVVHPAHGGTLLCSMAKTSFHYITPSDTIITIVERAGKRMAECRQRGGNCVSVDAS